MDRTVMGGNRQEPNPGFPFSFHWESAITGCTMTNDRLAAAELQDTATCRFCEHRSSRNRTLPFSFGPNFAMLGIVELPLDTSKGKNACF